MIEAQSGVCFLKQVPAHRICGYTTKHFPVFLSGASELTDKKNQTAFKSSMNTVIKNEAGVEGFRRFAFLNQVHGNEVVVLDKTPISTEADFSYFLAADAIISNQKDTLIMAMTADCLSVFFFAGDWIGIAHAGWRGTKLGISEKTLTMICQHSGIAPDNAEIHFGPCIRKNNYEVGSEFMEYFPDSTELKTEKYYFDIALENKKRLLGAGASKALMHDTSVCTNDQVENLYSYRLEKQKAGRMVSFAGFIK